jgi:hypothetical protein
VLIVPVLVAVFGVSDLIAKGTSLLAMVPTAASGRTLPATSCVSAQRKPLRRRVALRGKMRCIASDIADSS